MPARFQKQVEFTDNWLRMKCIVHRIFKNVQCRGHFSIFVAVEDIFFNNKHQHEHALHENFRALLDLN